MYNRLMGKIFARLSALYTQYANELTQREDFFLPVLTRKKRFFKWLKKKKKKHDSTAILLLLQRQPPHLDFLLFHRPEYI